MILKEETNDIKQEATKVYLDTLSKEVAKLGYDELDAANHYYSKSIDKVDVFISPEHADGELSDNELIVTVALDSVEAFAETENEIDDVANRLKKALEAGKADLEKAKTKVLNK